MYLKFDGANVLAMLTLGDRMVDLSAIVHGHLEQFAQS